MADYQAVFRRIEFKYLMDEAQTRAVEDAICAHMNLDRYGRTEMRNVYFDTPDWLLVRRSIEKPIYKEKLRLRSYGPPDGPSGRVYAEIKKKYDGIVYKRRIGLRLDEAERWLYDGEMPGEPSQIKREIDWIMHFYPGIGPAMNLDYERRAYYPPENDGFRITLDQEIYARTYDIGLDKPSGGTKVLPEGATLMEVKSPGGIPMWLTEILSELRLYKTSFSKYGNAYKDIVMGMPARMP